MSSHDVSPPFGLNYGKQIESNKTFEMKVFIMPMSVTPRMQFNDL